MAHNPISVKDTQISHLLSLAAEGSLIFVATSASSNASV
jgi:hypothetical protein